MKDNLIDRELRSRLKNVETEVPAVVKERIDFTLASLPERRRPRGKFWGFTAAAVVLLILAMGVSDTSPGMANAVVKTPVIGSIFEYVGDIGLKIAGQGRLFTAIREEDTDKGITLRLQEVVYDGVRLGFGYIVETEKEIFSPWSTEDELGLDFEVETYINGRMLRSGMSFSPLKKIGPSCYAGNFSLDSLFKDNLPDQFNLQVYIPRIGDIKGKWKLNVPVQKIAEGVRMARPNIVKNAAGMAFNFQKVIVTSFTTYIKVKIAGEDAAKKPYSYQVFDDKGRKLQLLRGEGNSSSAGVVVQEFIFSPVGQEVKYVTIRLVNRDTNEELGVAVKVPLE